MEMLPIQHTASQLPPTNLYPNPPNPEDCDVTIIEPPPPSYDEAVQMGEHQLAQSLQAEELELARTMDSTRAVAHQHIIPEGEVLFSAPPPMNPPSVWEQNVHQDSTITRPSQHEGHSLPGYQQSLPPSIDCDCGVMTMCCCSSCYPIYYGSHVCVKPLEERMRSTWTTGISRMKEVAFPVLPFWVQLIWIILQAILTLASMFLTAAVYVSQDSANTPVCSLVQLILLVITAIVALLDLALDLVCLGWLRKESVYAKYSDPFRIAIFEVLLYPAVICSLIDIVENERSSNSSRLRFASSVTVGVLFTFSVYLARLVIVGTLSVHLCKREGVRSLGIHFLTGLFVNLVIQSIIQILLLVLIGIRFEAEQNDDTVSGISPFLWIMIVLGELIPLAGIFAFFITTHKCVEDVPIEYVIREEGLCARGPGYQFNERCTCFQPCVSPVQIIVCAIFALLVLGFFLCFPLTLDSSGDVVTAFGERDFYGTSDSSYMVLFSVGLSITVLANVFPLITGAFWLFVAVAVVVAVILVIIFGVIVLILWCACGCKGRD